MQVWGKKHDIVENFENSSKENGICENKKKNPEKFAEKTVEKSVFFHWRSA